MRKIEISIIRYLDLRLFEMQAELDRTGVSKWPGFSKLQFQSNYEDGAQIAWENSQWKAEGCHLGRDARRGIRIAILYTPGKPKPWTVVPRHHDTNVNIWCHSSSYKTLDELVADEKYYGQKYEYVTIDKFVNDPARLS